MEYEISLKIGEPSYKSGLKVEIRLASLPDGKVTQTIDDAIATLNDALKPLVLGDKDA